MAALRRRDFLSLLGTSALAPLAFADTKTYTVEMRTITYASPGGIDLMLDLYLPQGLGRPAPVIVFIHGGGWIGGTRAGGPDFKAFFAQNGFAIASIDYRLVPSIIFPSNVEDVKTSIRWLRANASMYGFNPQRIGLWGTSAGAQLAAIAALTPRGKFEGEGNSSLSSAVQCVLDAYGPSSLLLLDAEIQEEKAALQPINLALAKVQFPAAGAVPHDNPTSPESKLVGAPIQTVPDKVKAASPLTYAREGSPPFLIMHGLADNAVPHHQSILMYEALAAANNDVTLRLIDGLPHGFFGRNNVDQLAGPFRMDVRMHPANGYERKSEERANIYDVAREFFTKHLA